MSDSPPQENQNDARLAYLPAGRSELLWKELQALCERAMRGDAQDQSASPRAEDLVPADDYEEGVPF